MDDVDYGRLRLNLWEDPALRAELTAWVEARLAERGLDPSSEPPRVRVRPWSTTARFGTSGGAVWFKAGAPGATFEAALAGALHSWVPGRVLAPIAVDAKRGWTLIPDAGPPLVDLMGSLRDFSVWEAVLQAYAESQRALADRVRDMLTLGVPDLRPPSLGRRLDSLLADRPVAAALGGPALAALTAFRPEFDRLCDALADSGVPASLDHSDLNMGNVFAHGGYRFADWGDASIAHPFTSLLVPLDFIASDLSPPPGTLARLRDAYLEPWSATAPPAALRQAVPPALRLGTVSRALTWTRAFPELRPTVLPFHHRQSAAWLHRLTEDFLPI